MGFGAKPDGWHFLKTKSIPFSSMAIHVGMVVPEERNCGIYTYSHFLLSELEKTKGMEVESVSNTCGSGNEKYAGLAQYLGKSFDIVHIQYEFGRFGKFFVSGTSTSAFYKSFPTHTNVVTTLHELPKSKNPFIRFMHERFLSTILSRSNIIIVHTQEMARLKEKYPTHAHKIIVIPHGMVTPKILAEKTRLPSHLKGKKIIGFFGFVVPHKNVDQLIEILPSLPPEYVLVIAGGTQGHEEYVSSLMPKAEELGVSSRIHWTGFVEDSKISEILSWMDVVVFPYRQVTESGTLHIALGHHRNVFTSDLPAFKEIENEYGCLRTYANTDELLQMLREWDIEEWKKEMGKGIEKFTRERNWKTVASLHAEVYSSLLTKKD
jgi:glycosyltransferase involved in cell wall biosynthesis